MIQQTNLLKVWAKMPPHMLRDLQDENPQALAWATVLQYLLHVTLQKPEQITNEELYELPRMIATSGHYHHVCPELTSPENAARMVEDYYAALSCNKERLLKISGSYKQSPEAPWIYQMVCCAMSQPGGTVAARAWLKQHDFVLQAPELTGDARQCLEMHCRRSGLQPSV